MGLQKIRRAYLLDDSYFIHIRFTHHCLIKKMLDQEERTSCSYIFIPLHIYTDQIAYSFL
jgi:hypothetical protein